MTIEEQAGLVKLASPKLAGTTGELRDQALLAVAKALMDNKDAIFDANRQDMEQAEKDGIAAPVLKRLKFDEGKLRDVINGIHDLVQMPYVTWGTNPGQGIKISGVVPDPASFNDETERTAAERAIAYMGLTPGMRIKDIAVEPISLMPLSHLPTWKTDNVF